MIIKEQKKARFITFEGIDGAGKSTHLTWFAQRLRQQLSDTQGLIVTREPGGTPLGEALRTLLLHQTMHLETEALLMFAARREHIAQVIEPALARGDWVLSDRFTDATFAYQGGGRGLAQDKLEVLENWVQQGLQPDLTLLFDISYDQARARLHKTRALDKFENEASDFFERIRTSYLARAKAQPQRFIVLDASQTIETIQQKIEAQVMAMYFQ